MSILIKDMEMPKSCMECPFSDKIAWCLVPGDWRQRYYMPEEDISEDCPLSEIEPCDDAVGRKSVEYPLAYYDNWILCTPDTMPEESVWVGAEELGVTISDEVFVTFEEPNGERFVKQLRFHGGKLGALDQYFMDIHHKGSVPIAWKPLPKPYQG